jgi:hypothetical protein
LVSLRSRSSSRILEIIGRRLIGLYEATSVGGFAGFNTIITFASFKFVGQYSRRIVAFKMHNTRIVGFLILGAAVPVPILQLCYLALDKGV